MDLVAQLTPPPSASHPSAERKSIWEGFQPITEAHLLNQMGALFGSTVPVEIPTECHLDLRTIY